MVMFKTFINKLGNKKLSDGVSREDVELYRKGKELLESSKNDTSYDDLELFVNLIKSKKERKIIL